MEKLLIPENDLQELWELNGRVKAVLAWVESCGSVGHIRSGYLAAMLGTPVQMGCAPKQPQAQAEGDNSEAEDVF